MTKRSPQIAIIGAGLTGAILTRRLLEMGCKLSVFDKSRGTGGRISSCRLDDISADLGAPYFEGNDPDFSRWLRSHSHIRAWQPKHRDFKGESLAADNLYVTEPRQSALTRDLLDGADLITQARVGFAWPEKQDGQKQVILRDTQGKGLGHFDAAIITTPSPQAVPLLEAIPRFAKQAAKIQASASWVAVLKTSSTPHTADLFSGEHPVLHRCIRDTAKPGRFNTSEHDVWCIEANQNWSKLHISSEPEEVFSILKSAFFELLEQQPEVTSYRCHRWLYSRQNGIAKGYLWDAETGLGAAGDWLQNGGLLGAWQSANMLADQLISDFNLQSA